MAKWIYVWCFFCASLASFAQTIPSADQPYAVPRSAIPAEKTCKVTSNRYSYGIKAGVGSSMLASRNAQFAHLASGFSYNLGVAAEYADKKWQFLPSLAFQRSDFRSFRLNSIDASINVGYAFARQTLFGATCPQPVKINVIPYLATNLGSLVVSNDALASVTQLNRFQWGTRLGVSTEFGTFEPMIYYEYSMSSLGEGIKTRGVYFSVAMLLGR